MHIHNLQVLSQEVSFGFRRESHLTKRFTIKSDSFYFSTKCGCTSVEKRKIRNINKGIAVFSVHSIFQVRASQTQTPDAPNSNVNDKSSKFRYYGLAWSNRGNRKK